MSNAKTDNRKGNHNAVGHQRQKPGHLLYGAGCDFSKTCFECPEPDCRYDTAKSRALMKKIRALEKAR